MPIIAQIGLRTFKGRCAVFLIYALLVLMGLTMVFPFLITLSGSTTNEFDYDRFHVVPRSVWSRSDRFVKGLVYFFNVYHGWHEQMGARFRTMPDHWSTWSAAGQDRAGIEALAEPYLHPTPEQWQRWKVMAADVAEFTDAYPVEDMLPAMRDVEATPRLLDMYTQRYLDRAASGTRPGRDIERHALDLLQATWDTPIENVYAIEFEFIELWLPYWHQSWYPPNTAKFRDFQSLKLAFRNGYAQPGVRRGWMRFLAENGVDVRARPHLYPVDEQTLPEIRSLWLDYKKEHAPAGRAVPLAMRVVWRKYLSSEEVADRVGLSPGESFGVDTYNRLAGTDYASLFDTPFPVPPDAPEPMQSLWVRFVETRYPLRLTSFDVTPEMANQYHDFLRDRFKTLERANRLLNTEVASWARFALSPTPPTGEENPALRDVWYDFGTSRPFEERIITSSEHAFQHFLLARYGSLEAVNAAYGWNLGRIEEAFAPFDAAYAVTFMQNERAFVWAPVGGNYATVVTFLLGRGRSILVTFFLVALAILATLTVNPLAAYGLSRFAVRGKDKIILFLLATMAFPAMVSAIPAYLLMRDLNLLNTFFALVLPYAANGMSIFILKGFFDSLPHELYDAATIDGAGEIQIFARITMPMMKPILAIQSLYAFLWAYNSWEWALIICQKKNMWTLAVWLFQADSSWWADTPWITTAGFVVISIPTLVVFLSCQKIILRGIIIPTMK